MPRKKAASLKFQPAAPLEKPEETESGPVVIDKGWSAEVVWFNPSMGLVGIRYKLNGKLLFCTKLRKELLEAVRGGWEGMDKIPWVDRPPLGWDGAAEGQASEEAAHKPPKKEE